jgi:integrase/recombinase XerD
MHQEQCTSVEAAVSLREAIAGCLEAERDCGLQERSLKALEGYLGGLAGYCEGKGIATVGGLTPDALKDFVLARCGACGPPLVKAVVWSLRKLGCYLALRGLVSADPAVALRHPKISPRARVPRYLTSAQVRQLLGSAARSRPRLDLVVLSLLVSTGLRPHEVVGLARSDIQPTQHLIEARVKGGWRKRTPLSPSMAALLGDYLASREDHCPAAFVGARLAPMSVSWLQRMVRDAGQQAGLEVRLTPRLLRHTFATHVADRHGKVIAKALLGHRRLATTEVYTHLSHRRFAALMSRHPYQAVIRGGQHG